MSNTTSINTTNATTTETRKVENCGIQHIRNTEVTLKKDNSWMDTIVAIGGIWRTKEGYNNYNEYKKADGTYVDGPFTYREEKFYAHKVIIQKTICHSDFQASDLTFSKENNDMEQKLKLYEFHKEIEATSELGKKLLNLHKIYKRNCICNYKKEDSKYYCKTQIIAIDDKDERYQIFNIYTDCNYDIDYVNNKYGYWD